MTWGAFEENEIAGIAAELEMLRDMIDKQADARDAEHDRIVKALMRLTRIVELQQRAIEELALGD